MTHSDTLSVRINGEARRVSAGTTIAALVAEIGLDPARVAVEDGDAFEIVHFVGGG